MSEDCRASTLAVSTALSALLASGVAVAAGVPSAAIEDYQRVSGEVTARLGNGGLSVFIDYSWFAADADSLARAREVWRTRDIRIDEVSENAAEMLCATTLEDAVLVLEHRRFVARLAAPAGSTQPAPAGEPFEQSGELVYVHRDKRWFIARNDESLSANPTLMDVYRLRPRGSAPVAVSSPECIRRLSIKR